MSKFLLSLTLIVFLPMNVYSRALRYIDMNDVKQKHHQKLMERKIRKEEKNKLIEEFKYKNSPLYSNWRSDITEQMTSSDMFFTTLPSTGDIEYPISDNITEVDPGGIEVVYDTSVYDTLVLDVVLTGDKTLGIFSSDFTFIKNITSSGTHSFEVGQSKQLKLYFLMSIPGEGSVSINDVRAKRITPLNVFISLDSPEATAFVRTGSGDLSPEEKLKQLKEMLKASDEYVQQMYGDQFPGSGAVPPGEAGTTPGVETIDYGEDLTPLSNNPYGTEVGQVAGTYDLIKSGQVPYMKPEKAKQILSDPKYQKIWDNDPDALKAVQKMMMGV